MAFAEEVGTAALQHVAPTGYGEAVGWSDIGSPKELCGHVALNGEIIVRPSVMNVK
jgi:hypothetical protein